MSIGISGGPSGITVETDPTALKLTGGTVTGKLSCTVVSGVAGINLGLGGTDAASTTAGDLWLQSGSSYLNFRDGSGVWRNCLVNNTANTIDVSTATTPALRITQRGAANAFVVEDSTTPDSSAFVINNAGQVVIGGTSSANGAVGLTIVNGINCSAGANSANMFNGELHLSSISYTPNIGPFSAYYPSELQVVINGQTAFIPYRT